MIEANPCRLPLAAWGWLPTAVNVCLRPSPPRRRLSDGDIDLSCCRYSYSNGEARGLRHVAGVSASASACRWRTQVAGRGQASWHARQGWPAASDPTGRGRRRNLPSTVTLHLRHQTSRSPPGGEHGSDRFCFRVKRPINARITSSSMAGAYRGGW